MNNIEIYVEALKKWGRQAQLWMLAEECAECIVAVNKLSRNPTRTSEINLINELVDVSIMVEQIKLVFDDGERFERTKQEKLDRLKERLTTSQV